MSFTSLHNFRRFAGPPIGFDTHKGIMANSGSNSSLLHKAVEIKLWDAPVSNKTLTGRESKEKEP